MKKRKKISLGILSVLLSLLMIVGCTGKGETETSTSQAPEQSTSPKSDSSVTNPTTTGTPVTGAPSQGTETTPTLPEPDATHDPSELYEAVPGVDNLYLLDIDGIELDGEYYVNEAALWNDRLLVSAFSGSEYPSDGQDEWNYTVTRRVFLIGLRTGKLMSSITTDNDAEIFTFLEDGTVCSYCLDSYADKREALLYDDSLTVTDRFDGSDCPDIFCGMEGDGTLWFYDSEKGCLKTLCPFGDKQEKEYTVAPGYAWIQLSFRQDDLVYLTFIDTQYLTEIGVLNLSDGSLTMLDNLHGMQSFNGGSGLFGRESGGQMIMVSADNLNRAMVIPKTNEYESCLTEKGGLMLTGGVFTTEGDGDFDEVEYYSVYRLYRPADGVQLEPVGSEQLSGLTYLCMDEFGNVVFWTYDPEKGPEIMYWEGGKGDETQLGSDYRVIDLTAIDDENSELEQKIYDRFGIHVYYDELSLTDLVSDYTCAVLTDNLLIGEGLENLYLYLSLYPDGFFEDACAGGYNQLEIYLCGTFTPVDDYGINTAAALTSTKGSTIIMAFNLDYIEQMKTNLAHELMHVMEHRLWEYEYSLDFPFLGYWECLNPEDFTYYYSYHDENGDEITETRYTSWDTSEGAEVWFVDPYSTSYPTEDRARIFENLYTNQTALFESPYMQAKAEYLCALIRAAFPSVAESDSVSWEMFGRITIDDFMDELEEYQEQLFEQAVG
ncbi:MAG: hypothetical protein ACI3XR_04665 [Eubacteriales bacterium]